VVTLAILAAAASCMPPEKTLFTCSTGRREIVICASDGDAAYRSYRNGGLELQLVGGKTARTVYSGGGGQQIIFVNGPWRYVATQGTARTGFGVDGRNDPKDFANVMLIRGRRTVSILECRNQEDLPFRMRDVPLPETTPEHP
jgi:hypothetical protein